MPRTVQLVSTGLVLSLAGVGVGYLWYKRRSRDKREAKMSRRIDQGDHEIEVLCNRSPIAMECEVSWKVCAKNPGHPNFIPALEFSKNHLPEAYRIPGIFELIQNVSARTVRLRVYYTSRARSDGYPFHNCRGEWVLRTASGWIRDIHVCHGPCRCPQCKEKALAKSRWWLIRVQTACHVVFDTTEAQQTLVDVFYDSEKSEQGRNGMKTVQGLRVIVKSEDQDLCRLYCITHDKDLVNRLQGHMKQWEKQPTTLMTMPHWEENHAPFCVVVSHPHGYSKRVSIGEWAGHTEQNEIGECALTYRTDTCTGSSGAPVILPRWQEVDGETDWTPTIFPHSGALSHNVNQSAVGGVFPSI